MFDTMTLTKVVGGLCGALLIFLLGKWFAEETYHVGGGHGHGEEHAAGYVIEVASADTAEAAEEEAVPFEVVFAAADAAKGEKVFSKCKACHSLEDGKKGAGPSLFSIVGRAAESTDFGYSGKLVAVVDTWTPEHLNGFLEDPKGYTPGTKMNFKGLPKAEDRANLIAYLQGIN